MAIVKICLETNEGYLPIYWIKRTKRGIIGWYSDKPYVIVDKEYVSYVEVHFTYPPDGRYHTCLKSSNKDRELYRYYYPDHIKTKIISKGRELSKTAEDGKIASEEMLQNMLPRSQLPALSDYAEKPILRQLPVLGLNIFGGSCSLAGMRNGLTSSASTDDLTINMNEWSDGALNVCALLYGNGCKEPDPGNCQKKVRTDSTAWPHIQLRALFWPTPIKGA